MRNLLILVVLIFIVPGAIGAGPSASKISQLPDGTLSRGLYSNAALGLIAELPDGWIADPDFKKLKLDYRNPNGPANECSKILLLLQPRQQKDGFRSVFTVFAIDPDCFPGTTFPKSLEEAEVDRFADAIVKSFASTPFISPKGADVSGSLVAGQPVIILTGDNVIKHPGNNEAIHVNIKFSLRASGGYWVAWAALADDSTKEELKKWHVLFKVP